MTRQPDSRQHSDLERLEIISVSALVRPAVLPGMDIVPTSPGVLMRIGGSKGWVISKNRCMSPISRSESDLQLPHPHPGVIFNTLSDGAVLLHAPSEIYFGLNRVGSRVWQLLPPECESFEELCHKLSQEYPEVGADDLIADVRELLESLRAHQLVVSP